MRNQEQEVLQNLQLSSPNQVQSFIKAKNRQGSAIKEMDSSEKCAFALHKVKLELVNSKKNLLIEKIKKEVIELVYYSEKQIKTNFSDYLSEKLGYHYTYMANLFTKIHGNSIQNFIIATRIERVKELLIYEDITLTEISFKLHYSSVAHLSNQFKKVTGFTPSKYLASTTQMPRLLPNNNRKTITTKTEYSKDDVVVLSFVLPQTARTGEEIPQQMEG